MDRKRGEVKGTLSFLVQPIRRCPESDHSLGKTHIGGRHSRIKFLSRGHSKQDFEKAFEKRGGVNSYDAVGIRSR